VDIDTAQPTLPGENDMLKSLFGKHENIKRVPDQIWQSHDLKLAGLLTFMTSLNPAKTRVLLVAHFADTLHALEQVLAAHQLDFRTYPTVIEGRQLLSPAEYQAPGCILLALSRALPDGSLLPGTPNASSTITLHVLVAEHHPLTRFDDAIVEAARHLPYPGQVGFYESLDGAFLRYCGSDEVTRLIANLHIPDNECLSSPMIDTSIRRAQEKIEHQAVSSMTADSCEQWLRLNLPGKS
jgi:preprotein translocase subunit SecA